MVIVPIFWGLKPSCFMVLGYMCIYIYTIHIYIYIYHINFRGFKNLKKTPFISAKWGPILNLQPSARPRCSSNDFSPILSRGMNAWNIATSLMQQTELKLIKQTIKQTNKQANKQAKQTKQTEQTNKQTNKQNNTKQNQTKTKQTKKFMKI